MSNLDNSIGKILIDLQKEDPDTFKKIGDCKPITTNYFQIIIEKNNQLN